MNEDDVQKEWWIVMKGNHAIVEYNEDDAMVTARRLIEDEKDWMSVVVFKASECLSPKMVLV